MVVQKEMTLGIIFANRSWFINYYLQS